MRTISMPASNLNAFFKIRKIATVNQLKAALKTQVTMTVYRKLKELDYISSCSHSGKYYTLKDIPDYDSNGLWFYKSVLFSEFCSLTETVKRLVDSSECGYTALELEKVLKVKPNEVLLKLINQKRVTRTKFNGNYIYYTVPKNERISQELSRKQVNAVPDLSQLTPDVLLNEVKASIILFYCTLNEKQRRLYAGLESLKHGGGGDQIVSDLLNLNIKTVARGRKELLGRAVEIDTVRTPGAGRKKKS